MIQRVIHTYLMLLRIVIATTTLIQELYLRERRTAPLVVADGSAG